MISYGRRLAIVSLETDLSAIRLVAALRRASVVAAFLIAGREIVSDQIGVSAAVAALLVGLLDKGPSPRAAATTMLVATALFAGVTAVAGLASHLRLLNVLLMAALAFAAGIGHLVNSRATQVFLFAAVMAASFSIRPVEPDTAITAAIAVAVAGVVQALLARLSSPVIRDWPERRRVLNAIRSASRLLRDVAQQRGADESTRLASRELNEADQAVSGSDLDSDRLDAYRLLLGDVDELRLEARALEGRRHIGIHAPDDQLTRDTFAGAALALDCAARALAQRFTAATRECEALDLAVAAIIDLHSRAPTPPTHTAQAVVSSAKRLPNTVRRLVAPRRLRRTRPSARTPRTARLKAAVHPKGLGFRQGTRLALAAVVGESLGLMLGLNYSSWVAVTAMMVLRPDVGPTVPRILMRAIGATIGVGLVVALLVATGQSVPIMVVIIAILAVEAYTFAQVNNAIMVGSMTMLIVSLLSLAGADPMPLAVARLGDVLVGCVVGSVFAFVIPIWTRDKLIGQVAGYARASAAWFVSVAQSTQTADHDAQALMRSRAREARAAGKRAEANLETALLEPATKRVNTGKLSLVIAWTRRANEAGVSAEVMLRHGVTAGPLAAEYANRAAIELAAAADELQSIGTVPSTRNWVDSLSIDHRADGGRVSQCLARAAMAGNAAHRAGARARASAAS